MRVRVRVRAVRASHLPESSGRTWAGPPGAESESESAQVRRRGTGPRPRPADVGGWDSPECLGERKRGREWKPFPGNAAGRAGRRKREAAAEEEPDRPSGNCSDSNGAAASPPAPGGRPTSSPLPCPALPCPGARYCHFKKTFCQQIYDKKYK